MTAAALVKKARDLEGMRAVWTHLREKMDMELIPMDERSAPRVKLLASEEQIYMVMEQVDDLIDSMSEELEKLLGSDDGS